jgi:hypothetical protein
MACGGCGARRAARSVGGDGKVTEYKVTWGDGSTNQYASLGEARLAMGAQSDDKKRRGMRVLSIRV